MKLILAYIGSNMNHAYFGFTEKPFTIAPNPRYLFMSGRHQEALAHMLAGKTS